MVTNQVVDYIYQAHGHKLTRWNNLLSCRTAEYADAIARNILEPHLRSATGLLTVLFPQFCRPSENQSTVYNGHKSIHALKFKSVTKPNGLITNLYGPVGSSHLHLFVYFFFTEYITDLYFALKYVHFKKL